MDSEHVGDLLWILSFLGTARPARASRPLAWTPSAPSRSREGRRSRTWPKASPVSRSTYDCIATSPLKRAKETALIAAKVLKKDDLVELWDELRPEGETVDLYRRLSKLKRDSGVMLVGHEPYLSAMIGELVSGTRQVRIVLKKAGVAKVEVTTFVPKTSGELRWLMTPRQMKKMD